MYPEHRIEGPYHRVEFVDFVPLLERRTELVSVRQWDGRPSDRELVVLRIDKRAFGPCLFAAVTLSASVAALLFCVFC
ncbi:hypothetical protein [Chachezhania sediminis]|uniref:hypothetical protein n=1 Tax=Chachezhania sediminis TaxID=2599291 RepID=UPI00131D9504|nr:hypothetical protein [Chachezhania sediminis]